MERLTKIDISTVETKKVHGDTLKRVRYEPNTKTYVFKRLNEKGKLLCYEVVRGKRHINPDGNIVHSYPSIEDWGHYGLTVSDNWYAKQMIDFLCSSEDWSPETRYNFKKSLAILQH